jgi:hypothetical protein
VTTESVVALPHGSASGRSDSPRASGRARVNGSVTHRDRVRVARGANLVAGARRMGRVMYLDAADSWIVRDSTPSIRQVWAADYTAAVPGDYAPFRFWCRGYRYPAVAFAALLDSAKWLLIHPVRGPLFLTAVGAGIAAAIH